jgi:hypothetical protein
MARMTSKEFVILNKVKDLVSGRDHTKLDGA